MPKIVFKNYLKEINTPFAYLSQLREMSGSKFIDSCSNFGCWQLGLHEFR